MQQWNRQPNYRLRAAGSDAPYKEIRVLNPSRGINLLIADILANDKEATEGTRNIEYVEGGAARKRMGYQEVETSTELSNSPRGLGQFISESANYPITVDGDTLKKYQSGTWSALSGVTVDSTANITITSLFEKTFVWDGVNGGVTFDGSTVTRDGKAPKAKFSVIYKGYHVASGVDGQQFRLYFAPNKNPGRFTNNITPSDPDDVAVDDATEVPGATVFTDADATVRAIDINKNDGQKIMGLGFFQDVLIIFKERSIYQLYFNASNGFVVERISSSYGTVSHGSIQAVENDTYFLTEKGVYVLGNEPNFFASIRTNELSSRVKTLMERINATYYERCIAYYTDDRYFLSLPLDSNTECNALIVYDRRFYSWAHWDNLNVNDMLVFKDKDNDGESYFYFTEYGSASMCQFTPGVYRDKDAAITATFITKAFEGKELDKTKYWYTLRPIFRLTTGEVQISYITENGSEGKPVSIAPVLTGGMGVDQYGNLLLGTSQQDTYTNVDLGISSGDTETASSETDSSHTVFDIGVTITSRTLKVKFVNDGLDETFTLLGWVLLYQEKDSARFSGAYTVR